MTTKIKNYCVLILATTVVPAYALHGVTEEQLVAASDATFEYCLKKDSRLNGHTSTPWAVTAEMREEVDLIRKGKTYKAALDEARIDVSQTSPEVLSATCKRLDLPNEPAIGNKNP